MRETREYRNSVLPPAVPVRLAIEAGVTQGWHRYVGDRGGVVGIDRFGASAPGDELMQRLWIYRGRRCAGGRWNCCSIAL